MAGIGVQQLFICVFFLFAVHFHKAIGGGVPQNALLLLYSLYIAVILISVGSILHSYVK